MNQDKVIFFIFAGRRKYMEIQRLQLDKALEQFDNVELHLWNFSRNSNDNEYLQNLSEGRQDIVIFNQFYEGDNNITQCIKRVGVLCGCQKCRVGKWSEPYKYYAAREDLAKATFIKVDDDVLFLDHRRISSFVRQVKNIDLGILSAEVVNNGICAALNDGIRQKVFDLDLVDKNKSAQPWWWLCTNKAFFELSHTYFFEHHQKMLNDPFQLQKLPRTRFSINTIAFNWKTMCAIAENLGGSAGMNDEGVISEKIDITVMRGFVSCHLHFSDQRSQITDDEERVVLDSYGTFSTSYA